MATTFTRNGLTLVGDFVIGDLQIPFQNLSVWDDATLEHYGIVKTITVDVPQVISDRQFFQQLAVAGTITEEEALAAVQVGTIPPPLEAFVSTLPEGDEFTARMLLSGATEFYRAHPLVAAVGTVQGMTSEQIDAFFIAAAAL